MTHHSIRMAAAVVAVTSLLVSRPSRGDTPDAACEFCVHDNIQHRFRIENHPVFHAEQVLQDRCAAVEFPVPVFRVAADGTQSSIFDVTQVVEGSCASTLTDPEPHFLDDRFQPIENPDFDTYGAANPIDRRPGYVRFQYTHPRTPPDDGDKFRVIRIGIFYIDRRNPRGPEHLASVLEIRVYRTPVVMIHGLWSDARAFESMEQQFAATNYEPFQLYRLDYRNTNDSGFAVNYARVADGIDAVIGQSVDADLAAGKVDLVAHSMGGVLSRLYVQNPGYEHEVRRIVTSNTPHAGSQMANLLLDRTFDPEGLICSLLSQAMSSDDLPNRGCYNGAVDDLQVSSFATTNFLNLGVHPDEVEIHAVATVFDPADLPDISGVALAGGNAPFLIAEVLRACGLSLVGSVFGSDDNDLIVSATSQAGGLVGPLTSLYPDQPHMGAVANGDVIDGVKGLLNEPLDSDSFTRSGYDPSRLGYTTPSSLCPTLKRATSRSVVRSAAAAASLAITNPLAGSTISAGASLGVDVSGAPDVATIVLVMNESAGAMVLAEHPGPSARLELQVPGTALGRQNLVAAGLDAAGALVAVSDTVPIDVTTPAALESISVYPAAVYLRACGSATLEVTGHYEDGVARDLSTQTGLGFSFAGGHAARSGATGVVSDEALDDTLTVTLGDVDSPPVAIRILPTDDAGPCSPGTTTTSTTSSPSSTSTTSTTTPSSTTTSTTATPVSSTTTSTTLPGCRSSAECLIAAALSGPLCPADTIDPKLEGFATEKLGLALARVQEAEQATTSKRARRLLDRARKQLGRILRHRPGQTSDACRETLTARIAGLLDAIDDLRRR